MKTRKSEASNGGNRRGFEISKSAKTVIGADGSSAGQEAQLMSLAAIARAQHSARVESVGERLARLGRAARAADRAQAAQRLAGLEDRFDVLAASLGHLREEILAERRRLCGGAV